MPSYRPLTPVAPVIVDPKGVHLGVDARPMPHSTDESRACTAESTAGKPMVDFSGRPCTSSCTTRCCRSEPVPLGQPFAAIVLVVALITAAGLGFAVFGPLNLETAVDRLLPLATPHEH